MRSKIKMIFDNKSHNVLAQMFRYGLVSAAALAADFGVMVFTKEFLHINYLAAATIGFSVGIVVNYICSRLWVFQKSKLSSRMEFTIFLIVGITGLVFNDLIIWIATDYLLIYYMVSKIIATFIVFFWNFLLRKCLIYS